MDTNNKDRISVGKVQISYNRNSQKKYSKFIPTMIISDVIKCDNISECDSELYAIAHAKKAVSKWFNEIETIQETMELQTPLVIEVGEKTYYQTKELKTITLELYKSI
jgi:hypothetical protein